MKAHALALFTILVWSTTFVAALVWSVYPTLVDRIADAGYETLAATKRIFAWGLLFMMPAVPFAGAFPALGLVDPSSLRTCSSWGFSPLPPASPPGTSP
ncbi:hypothetical protein [Adlercreutzia equolifaciens]|uniref:hypothetical protein n=1 Tax=Adlercreutzia equolifaciens TaxID=446660 RepID=UPI0039F5AF3C